MKRPQAQDFVGLVWSIAHKMKRRLPYHLDVEDLAGAGMIGLIKATRDWKRGHGPKPNAYLGRRAAGAMLDFLRDEDHLSRNARAKLKMLKEKGKPLGRMGLHAAPPRGLIVEDQLISDPRRTNPLAGLEADDIFGWIRRHASARAALIFKLVFVEGRTMDEVGEQLGISQSMVCMTVNKARRKLCAIAGAA